VAIGNNHAQHVPAASSSPPGPPGDQGCAPGGSAAGLSTYAQPPVLSRGPGRGSHRDYWPNDQDGIHGEFRCAGCD